MNRRFHRWLDDHEIVKLFFMVTVVAAPSILLCVAGVLIAARLEIKYRIYGYHNGGWWLFAAGVTWAALWVLSRFHYLYRG